MIHHIVRVMLGIWSATTFAFLALAILPGDAVEAQLIKSGVDLSTIAERQAAAGLNDPILVRYLRFWGGALQGDLGESLISREPVVSAIGRNLVPTFALALGALLVAIPVGMFLGTVVTIIQQQHVTALANGFINLGLSVPIYWTGTLMIYLFSVQFGILPSSGTGSWQHLIMPVLVLALPTSGAIARVIRANMATILEEDFVRTARAKGLYEHQIVYRHILRVGLLPLASVIMLQAGFLLGGTVITESMFVRPGLGRLLLDATLQQDYPMVMGIVMLAALTYALLNLTADIITTCLDPRLNL